MRTLQPPSTADEAERKGGRQRRVHDVQIGTQRRARRQRYVSRQADGKICLSVEVSEDHFAAALMCSGRLAPELTLRRGELERAAALIISDFVSRWRGRVP
jgi:hypothetical protein